MCAANMKEALMAERLKQGMFSALIEYWIPSVRAPVTGCVVRETGEKIKFNRNTTSSSKEMEMATFEFEKLPVVVKLATLGFQRGMVKLEQEELPNEEPPKEQHEELPNEEPLKEQHEELPNEEQEEPPKEQHEELPNEEQEEPPKEQHEELPNEEQEEQPKEQHEELQPKEAECFLENEPSVEVENSVLGGSKDVVEMEERKPDRDLSDSKNGKLSLDDAKFTIDVMKFAPLCTTSQTKVKIVRFENPIKYFVEPMAYDDERKNLQTLIDVHMNEAWDEPAYCAIPNEIVVVSVNAERDREMRRARVIRMDKSMAHLELVDYGYSINIKSTCVRRASKEIAETPIFGIGIVEDMVVKKECRAELSQRILGDIEGKMLEKEAQMQWRNFLKGVDVRPSNGLYYKGAVTVVNGIGIFIQLTKEIAFAYGYTEDDMERG